MGCQDFLKFFSSGEIDRGAFDVWSADEASAGLKFGVGGLEPARAAHGAMVTRLSARIDRTFLFVLEVLN